VCPFLAASTREPPSVGATHPVKCSVSSHAVSLRARRPGPTRTIGGVRLAVFDLRFDMLRPAARPSDEGHARIGMHGDDDRGLRSGFGFARRVEMDVAHDSGLLGFWFHARRCRPRGPSMSRRPAKHTAITCRRVDFRGLDFELADTWIGALFRARALAYSQSEGNMWIGSLTGRIERRGSFVYPRVPTPS
jgi:hypothetical protein